MDVCLFDSYQRCFRSYISELELIASTVKLNLKQTL